MNEEFLKYLVTFPLVSEADLIPPCASSKGVQGHGEGISFGKTTGGRKGYFFYRYAGRKLPKEGLSYLTCEDNFFSRQMGERSQIIVFWDEPHQGFRILMECGVKSGFKSKLQELTNLGPVDAVISLGKKAEKQAEDAARMQELIDSGADIF
ncbi:TPA: hypothetical protein ACSCYS_003526 [Aeromonas veronii]